MNQKTFMLSLLAVIALAVVFILVRPQSEHTSQPEFKCRDAIGCVTIQPNEPLKIALLQPRSGRLKDMGTVQIRGIKLALNRFNHQLLDHPIELVTIDSKCSPEGGGVAALKAVADPQIVAIIGPVCSGAGTQASKVMSEAGLVMISGTNSAASLTSQGGKAGANWHPGYFRSMFNSIRRGEAGAIFTFRELGITRAATIHDGDNRSKELTEIFEQTFLKLGGEIVLSTAIDRKDTNMKPVLKRVANSGAELIFFPFFPPETVYVTKQSREIEELSKTALMVCGSSVRTDAFITDVGDAGIGMYFVGKAALSGKSYDHLKAEYELKYPDMHDDLKYPFAYDATNILMDALKSAIVESEDGTLHLGRQALRDAMYKISDFKGTTGNLRCDQFGDCGTPRFNILQLQVPSEGIEGLMRNEVFRYIPGQ